MLGSDPKDQKRSPTLSESRAGRDERVEKVYTTLEKLTQMQYTRQQLEERFLELPVVLREAMFDADIAERIMETGKNNGLNIEQIGELAEETGYVMMGMLPPHEFISSITERLGLSRDTGSRIASEINQKVFYPLREELKSTHNVDVSEEGIQRGSVAPLRVPARPTVAAPQIPRASLPLPTPPLGPQSPPVSSVGTPPSSPQPQQPIRIAPEPPAPAIPQYPPPAINLRDLKPPAPTRPPATFPPPAAAQSPQPNRVSHEERIRELMRDEPPSDPYHEPVGTEEQKLPQPMPPLAKPDRALEHKEVIPIIPELAELRQRAISSAPPEPHEQPPVTAQKTRPTDNADAAAHDPYLEPIE